MNRTISELKYIGLASKAATVFDAFCAGKCFRLPNANHIEKVYEH